MIKIGDQIFTPPKLKSDFLAKSGVKSTKISQKLNQLRFSTNFQIKLKPINDESWWQKFFVVRPNKWSMSPIFQGNPI